jgi:putative FmdB family regulatory protein
LAAFRPVCFGDKCVPIYEYACKKCDHRLDALQKMSDDLLVDCPDCGEPSLKRLISAPRFRLKGQGWYETDFKKDNQRNLSSGDAEPAKSEKPKEDSSSTSGKEKTESKPDSKKKTTGSKAKADKSD